MRRKRSILLVHAQDENRATLQVMLKREGYLVMEADDAGAALEVIRDSLPDLVITQMRLPRISGAELIRTIRNDRSYPRLRVLAVGSANQRDDAERAGSDAFAADLSPERIAKQVTELIGRA